MLTRLIIECIKAQAFPSVLRQLDHPGAQSWFVLVAMRDDGARVGLVKEIFKRVELAC